MTNLLTATAELAPDPPKGLSAEQRIAVWADLVDACDELLWVGRRRQVGPGGDAREAYRHWYARRMEDHDRVLVRMLKRLSQAEAGHGV